MQRPPSRPRSTSGPLVLAGVLVLAVALVAGCGNGGTPSSDSGPAAPPSGAASGSTARPAGADEVPEPAPGQQAATGEPAVVDVDEVSPLITQAGWSTSGTGVEVSGFVPGITEDGGTCRVTLTRDGQTVTADRPGTADATTTQCGVVELGDAGMDSGWWQAVLSYESATAGGSSAPVDVLVPTR